MWTWHSEKLPDYSGLKFALQRDSAPATVADFLDGLQFDADLRTSFNSLLADTPYPEFRWETPSVVRETVTQPFECVVLEAHGLDRAPDVDAFAGQFEVGKHVVVFPNLGRDAVLVVPCPISDRTAYGHLATFVRLAPESQRHTLWQAVGQAMTNRVSDDPVWLSTAGAGVAWLHIRLDDRPKYYHFSPYSSPG